MFHWDTVLWWCELEMCTPSLWWYRVTTKHFLPPAGKCCLPTAVSRGSPFQLHRSDYQVSKFLLAQRIFRAPSADSSQDSPHSAGRVVLSSNFPRELCSVDQPWWRQGNHSLIHKCPGMTACQYKLKDQVLFMDCYTTSAETAHRLPLPQFQHKPPFVFPCCSGLTPAGSSVSHSHSHSSPVIWGEELKDRSGRTHELR